MRLRLAGHAAVVVLVVLAIALAFATPARAGTPKGCQPEPASRWAPAGWICPPRYGIGQASAWAGPGAAANSCAYPWRDCQPVAVESLKTGIRIVVTPVTWCMCWVGVTGPNGETERLIDLDPDMVTALGLDPDDGLFDVRVWPVDGDTGVRLPDTALGSLDVGFMAYMGALVLLMAAALLPERRP